MNVNLQTGSTDRDNDKNCFEVLEEIFLKRL